MRYEKRNFKMFVVEKFWESGDIFDLNETRLLPSTPKTTRLISFNEKKIFCHCLIFTGRLKR